MSIGQKKAFNVSLSELLQQRIASAADQAGQAWPCHVVSVEAGIVTVAFDVDPGILTLPTVSMPVAESIYVRLPVQVGDKGLAISASVSIGALSGLGAEAPPTLTNPGNLAAMVFVPVASFAWPATGFGDAVVVQGPDGVVLRRLDDSARVIIGDGGNITVVTTGNVSVEAGGDVDVTATGTCTVTAATINLNGTLVINGTPYLAHVHTLVQTGTDDSGPVGP